MKKASRTRVFTERELVRRLSAFRPRPTPRFYRRMAGAPWQRRAPAARAWQWLSTGGRGAVLLAGLIGLLLAASAALPRAGILPQPFAPVQAQRSMQGAPNTAGMLALYQANPQAGNTRLYDSTSTEALHGYRLTVPPNANPALTENATTLRYGTACCSTGGNAPVNGEPYDATFFQNYGTNPFVDTEDDNLSTFGLDVDTASYTVARSYLEAGYWPNPAAVRVEEVVNYFDLHYPAPQPGEGAMSINLEGGPAPFGETGQYSLVKIGLQGRTIEVRDRRPASLTFVIDVSGSMAMETRLETVKRALALLVEQLRADDTVAIVVYGSEARLVLEPTPATESGKILAAVNALQPDGSTNAAAGLRLGYAVAAGAFRKDGLNRVILCTDGVANNGETGADGILATVAGEAAQGITLTALGFGMANYNDVLLEQLADKGDGQYVYVDSLAEARRVFVENLTGTLQVIARDARVQVEFNPAVVSRYRLLGYENRAVADQRFRDDTVDAGEVGAGQRVTALYEVKFQPGATGQALVVRLRYQDPDSGQVLELARGLQREEFSPGLATTSFEFRLAAAAAEYAEILRGSYWAQGARLDAVLALLYPLQGERPEDAQLLDFVQLVQRAVPLQPQSSGP